MERPDELIRMMDEIPERNTVLRFDANDCRELLAYIRLLESLREPERLLTLNTEGYHITSTM